MTKLIIAGEGGQGIQVIGKMVAEVAFLKSLSVSYLPNFGVEQRGGVSLAFVQISEHDISFPKFSKADLLVILSPRSVERVAEYIDKETVIIFDNSIVAEDQLQKFKNEKIAIPASYYAKNKLVPKSFNIIILGAILVELGLLDVKVAKKIIQETFDSKYKKEPELKHLNVRALEAGMEIANGLKKETKWRKKILKK